MRVNTYRYTVCASESQWRTKNSGGRLPRNWRGGAGILYPLLCLSSIKAECIGASVSLSFTFTSSSDTILLSLSVALASLSPSLSLPPSLCISLSPDARGRPGRVVLLLACILRDLCNRRRRRRSPNDIHTEDASGGDEALPNNCGENAKNVALS